MQQRDEIEHDLGQIEWRALPGKKSGMIGFGRSADSPQQEGWPNQIDWMVEELEALNRTCRPLVKSLDASEWRPNDESDD